LQRRFINWGVFAVLDDFVTEGIAEGLAETLRRTSAESVPKSHCAGEAHRLSHDLWVYASFDLSFGNQFLEALHQLGEEVGMGVHLHGDVPFC